MKSLATTLALLMSLASAVDLRTRDAYLTGAEPLSDLAQSDRQEEIDTTLAQTKGWLNQIAPPFNWIGGSNSWIFVNGQWNVKPVDPLVPKWQNN